MPAALTITLGGVDITTKVDFQSLVMQLAGSQEIGSCDFDIVDEGLTVSATAESTLTVTEVSSATVLFGGFTRSPQTVLTTVGRIIHIKAYDYNALLDRSIVVSDSRVAGESDHARLVYLMGIYGTQFSSDYTQIATLNGSLPAQKFIAITLRQAIERVLGQASYKASYYVDATGRLHTYDRTVVTAAPFNIRVGTPGGGEIAPQDWTHDRDTDNLANAIYIVGATAAGSGWFTDVTSIATYGRRERFFNAPDSDTHAKASQVGLAVLGDSKDPVPRVTFTTKSPADGWRIGQSITVTSAQDNLSGASLRVAKVTTHYLNPAGDREYAIELGAPQVTLSALLAAAHGGGGGFPWHSPGGAGWASSGGIVGSGTTGGTVSGGGGCACNTPYAAAFVLDAFTPRVLSPTWGTATSGGTWAVAGQTGLTESVDGTNGIIDGTAVLSTLYRFETIPLPAGFGFGTEALIRFSYTGTWTSFQVSLAESFGVFVNQAGIDSTVLGGVIHLFPTASGSGGHTTGGTGTWATSGTGQPYLLRIGWPDNATVQTRVWLESLTEPTDWQATDAVGTGASWTPAYFMVGIYGGMKLTIDTISFNSTGPPNSGQPYPWTNLGTGNGSQTAFSALTAFRPGSLQVRVDTTTVTPLSQVATTGAFVLPFPPTSIESIWASWITA